MKLLLYLVILSAFYSCKDAHRQTVQNGPVIKGNHLVDSFGKVEFDTSTFKKLDCGLYINSSGIIAYKATDNSRKFDTVKPLDIYLTSVYNLDADSPGDDIREMRLVVDTTTFTVLAGGDFEDKTYVYRFTPMLDGGTIGMSKKEKRRD
ncbi:MAG: hypothetical protein J7502_19285 [Flavisolibacter sp.]|nr:hypothetical protein [Flavisolibacter sp.]